jgi:RNA polymerase sigma factor (sigma-70 family)
MSESDWLAKRFEANRAHLRAVAYRMLGSMSEAEDAVQEVWLRLRRADAGDVDNLGGWLTIVVARLCLDVLRARKSRREEPLGQHLPDVTASGRGARDPEADVALADAVGPALVVVLETLAPAERVAFVLHDLFDLSFEEIAPLVDRTPAAARQLASRARRRVRGVAVPPADAARRRAIVTAFLAASRDGDFEALVAVLAPDAVLRVDEAALQAAAANKWGREANLASEIRGRPSVADAFKGRARGVTPALIDGEPGAVWLVGGQPRSAFVFAVDGGQITEIDLIMDPARIADLDVEILDK